MSYELKEAGTLFNEAVGRPSLVFTPFDLRYMDYKETLSLLMGKEIWSLFSHGLFSIFEKWSSFCSPSKLVSVQEILCTFSSDGEPFPAKASPLPLKKDSQPGVHTIFLACKYLGSW